ncbi:MAG: hypothetical protein Fur0046_21700 [Cyanobacteria bacterium J069]|nr:MAG: sigma-70 family RNA polymerase sigma factor [Cyanobacteria bacterium J069]
MQTPEIPEANHPLIKSLSHYSDQELLTLLQRHPDAGQYFTALYCRYSPLVYTLIRHSARSPVQADYLFSITWRHLFHELLGLDLSAPGVTLQSWMINVTALCINQAELPPAEDIHYALESSPPPLQCFVERALDQVSPAQRLMIVMAQTFRWSEPRIAAYLQAEGEHISAAGVKSQLQAGYASLEAALPEDIRAIYLAGGKLENHLQGGQPTPKATESRRD